MRKIITVVAALAMALALAGCVTNVTTGSKSTMAASDTSASSSSSSSSSSSAQVKWTDAISGAAAAEGAGISTFGMPDRTVIADIVFTNPSYSYTTGVAQAKYETGAAELIVRKADGTHTAPLTDRDTAEFKATWSKTYEGFEVTCYGAARGASTYVTWKDGSKEYGVTLQGLGGDELSMDDEDVSDIVRAIKATDVVIQAASAPSSSSSSSNSTSQPSTNTLSISEASAKAAAESASGGSATSWYQDNVDGHGLVWVVTCVDASGNKMTYYVDNYGNPYNAEFDANSSTQISITEDEACAAAEAASGGKATSAYVTTTTNHGMCWYVTTVDENGNVDSYHVDSNGSAFNADFE